MKSLQRLLVLGLFVCGACIVAGCGNETAKPASTTPAADGGSDAKSDGAETEGTDAKPAADGAAAAKVDEGTEESGEYTMVSLKVPNMT